jgi:hypothetical protein
MDSVAHAATPGADDNESATRTSNVQTSIDLQWTAPDDCPSGASVRADVARILGDNVHVHRALKATAVIEREGAHWHTKIATQTPRGSEQRAFDADSCGAAARAVALILALAADEHASDPDSRGSDEGRAHVSTIPGPAQRAGGTPQRTRETSAASSHPSVAPRLLAWLSMGIDSATLHAPAGAVELAMGMLLAGRTYSARFEGYGSLYWPAITANVAPSDEEAAGVQEGGHFGLVSFGGRACAARVFGRLEVGPCVGGEADMVHVTAYGGASNPGGIAFTDAFVGGGTAILALNPAFAVRIRAEAAIPLSRARFEVDLPEQNASVTVLGPAPVSARGFAGVELHFF